MAFNIFATKKNIYNWSENIINTNVAIKTIGISIFIIFVNVLIPSFVDSLYCLEIYGNNACKNGVKEKQNYWYFNNGAITTDNIFIIKQC